MNLSQVKMKIHELTAMYFRNATVVWAEQIMPKPLVPYITLKTKSLNKSTFPISDDKGNGSYYPCSTILEVNLFTKGKSNVVGKNETANYENTALDDLMEFNKFLESPAIVDVVASSDLDIQLMPPIRDLTGLANDTTFRYQAMAEYTVSYTDKAEGYYGISNVETIPNPSGGGLDEYIKDSYIIRKVEYEEENVDETEKEEVDE